MLQLFSTPNKRTPHCKGQKILTHWCPLNRGSTVHACVCVCVYVYVYTVVLYVCVCVCVCMCMYVYVVLIGDVYALIVADLGLGIEVVVALCRGF